MIIHIDMDAFFASVEQRDFAQLRAKPIAVGGAVGNRGVISAASYEARKFGVKSAMPTAKALQLCPQLILRPTRMAEYVKISHHIREIFYRYTPEIEPLSLDEAFLDVSASRSLFGEVDSIAKRIKQDIADELQLVASVGIAKNKFLAKLASDFDKPDGFCFIQEGQEQAFLDPLPIHKIWGMGPATLKKLQKYQLRTVADLRQYSSSFYEELLGQYGVKLWQLIHGIDNRKVESMREAKSMSQETTFAKDIDDDEQLAAILINLVEAVGFTLRHKERYARTVTVKVKTADFKTHSRDFSFDDAIHSTRSFMRQALKLLTQLRHDYPVPLRLIGFGVSNFDHKPLQSDFLAASEQDRDASVDALADKLKKKYGSTVLTTARGLHTTKK